MFEVLSKAPSEAWVGLVGVIVGAAISLLGAWLTSKSSIKQLRIQLEHEEDAYNKNIQRERFEELYILLEHWLNSLFGNYLQLTLVMKGDMDYNEYLDKIIAKYEKQTFDFNRIEMIIDIYGKELRPAYDKVIEARKQRNDIEAEHKVAYKTGEYKAIRFLEPFTSAQKRLDEYAETLKELVAEAARNA